MALNARVGYRYGFHDNRPAGVASRRLNSRVSFKEEASLELRIRVNRRSLLRQTSDGQDISVFVSLGLPERHQLIALLLVVCFFFVSLYMFLMPQFKVLSGY